MAEPQEYLKHSEALNRSLAKTGQGQLTPEETALVDKLPVFLTRNTILVGISDYLTSFERKLLEQGVEKIDQDEMVKLFAVATNLLKMCLTDSKKTDELKKRIDDLHRMMLEQTILKDRMSLARRTF